MIQTFSPNFGVKATRGWCLMYVDDAGDVPQTAPPRVAKAKYAFNNEKNAGRISSQIDGPVGIWVVGFLDFTTGPYTADGHVFFMKHLGGGKYEIRDSEVATGARGPYGSLAELTAWFGAYKPKYLGWSTQCDGREYAAEGGFMNKNEIFWSYMLIIGDPPSDQETNSYLNNGKSYHDNEEDIKKWTNEKGTPYYKFKAQAAQQISDLQAQVRSLTQQLEAAQKAVKPGEAEQKLLAIKEALDIK